MKTKILFIIFIIVIFGCEQGFARRDDNSNQFNDTNTEQELEELEGIISFKEVGGSYIDVTQRDDGVYEESFANEFVNTDIIVTLTCTNGNDICDYNTTKSITITENNTGSLTIEDKLGRTLTKNFEVRKIDKTPPIGTIYYSTNEDEWSNGSITVTLSGYDNESWLVGNSSPSYTCFDDGGCIGTLSLTDSGGNILQKEYNISNIDKIPPIINVTYGIITNGKQEVSLLCTKDLGGSGCENENPEIYYLPTGISLQKCVYDNAGNAKCITINTANSEKDYSDDGLDWTSGNRTIWLSCIDNPGGSGCVKNIVTKVITSNGLYTLTIKDKAGNSITKTFLITTIDKVKPTIEINGPNKFKASETSRIYFSNVSDDLSGVKKITYNWNNICMIGNNIIGTEIEGNEYINYTKAGVSTLYTCIIDNAGNMYQTTKKFTIFPGDLDQNMTKIIVNGDKNLYANNNDNYIYTLSLKDLYNNSIYNKQVDITYDISNAGSDLIYTNMIDNSGNIATILYYDKTSKSDNNGNIEFNIKSLAPGKFSQNFKIDINIWGDDYINTNNIDTIYKDIGNNLFKKPIIGKLNIIEGGDNPDVGKEQKYQITLTNTGKLSNYFEGILDISKNTIINKIDGHFWREFFVINNEFNSIDLNEDYVLDSNLFFSGSIDVIDNVLEGVSLGSDNLGISYSLGGANTKYYLDDLGINSCSKETLGLKVIGTLQGDGKSAITGQDENISDLSITESSQKIRKNAYLLIKNMNSGMNLNGVKYIEGDVLMSGENITEYETLIVKNGNVIIDTDLNVDGDKLGIIVLKDNYNMDIDYNNQGNIYVNKDVDKINAIMYADGTFRSADSNGNSYGDNELNNLLELTGSLFSKNTIGGAIFVGNNYLLPGGQETNDYSLAEIYDLNYVRKVNNNCSSEDNYSFIIKYNPIIQLEPPAGFSN